MAKLVGAWTLHAHMHCYLICLSMLGSAILMCYPYALKRCALKPNFAISPMIHTSLAIIIESYILTNGL